MKWFLRLSGIILLIITIYVGVLGFESYQFYRSLKNLSAAYTDIQIQTINSRWQRIKTISQPLTVIPYVKTRITFIQSGIDLLNTSINLYSAVKDSFSSTPQLSAKTIALLQQKMPQFLQQTKVTLELSKQEPLYIQQHLPAQFKTLDTMLTTYHAQIPAIIEVINNLPQIVGYNKPMHYVVLFQNNMEIRPTGGFMGSYADVWINQGKLETFHIQDIYVPDGQIKGYVKEPLPIKKYLFNDNHPGWRLRDANWHPDFTQSTKAIDWFFQEGKLEPADGYIAVNLFPIIELLKQSPGIYLSDYNLTVNADNFYLESQSHAESNFFPGSTQKGDFLRSIGNALLIQLQHNPKLIQISTPILTKALIQKQIFVYIPNVNMPIWHALGWDGSLHSLNNSNNNEYADFLMVNEANMGSTKSNCCIDRSLSDTVSIQPDKILHHLFLTYKNNNPPKPQPPAKWGGGYKDYLRIITPSNVDVETITIDGKKVTDDNVYQEIFNSGHTATGFLVLTEGGLNSTVEVTYSLPITQSFKHYSLFFQKQAGIDSWPTTFTIQNQEFKQSINTDTKIESNIQ